MVSINNFSMYLYIFLLKFFFINNLLEIPLETIKVKGIPKYQNISIIEPEQKIITNNQVIFHQEGGSVINNDLLFLANIKIGSNSQKFNLVLDTGSYLLWVAKKGCSGSNRITKFFDPSASKTCEPYPYDQGFEITYGTGYCKGYYYKDNVNYISKDYFKMYFGVASRADFMVTGADGIIGLSKSYPKNIEGLSFVRMLKESGITDSLAFSFKFEMDTFTSNVKGKMFIGRHKDFSKSDVKSCPLTFYKDQIFWACQLNSFGLKGSNHESYSTISTNIMFDTGTNAIILPKNYLDQIEKDLEYFGCKAQENKEDGGIYLVCDSSKDVPDFNFMFNNHIFTIPKEYGFHFTSDKKYLISTITFSEKSAIIGSVFFFVFHTLFDEENNEMKFILNDGKIGGLSTFVIILIVVTSIATVLLLAYVIYYCYKKRKENENDNMLKTNNGGYYNQPLFNGIY